MTLGARIKAVRGELSQGEFADVLGVSKSAIGGYERDAQAPGSAVIMAICERFGVEPRWLLFGTGIFRTGERQNRLATAPGDGLIQVPIVEARLDRGEFLSTGETQKNYGFHSDFLLHRGDPARMVLMRADGDSMEPDIRHGDMVLIDQGQTAPLPGALFAVSLEGLVYIKRIDALPGRFILRSVNTAYPPIEIAVREGQVQGVRFVGRAVWLGRGLE
jgi:SOS-response transcriptional repressor LexA